MTAKKKAETEPKIGSRVEVLSADGAESLGYGTYMGRVPLDEAFDKPIPPSLPIPERMQMSEAERAETIARVEQSAKNGALTPAIILESGITVYGYQCWWREVQEEGVVH